MTLKRVELSNVEQPIKDCTLEPWVLSDETLQKRKEAVLAKMKEHNLHSLVIYGDVEHGSNFEYLVGFIPRFEEAVLVLHQNGEARLLLGNENLNKAPHARLHVEAIHVPHFSLPNQPMETKFTFEEIVSQSNIQLNSNVGFVGSKLFTGKLDNGSTFYDIPNYIVETYKQVYNSSKFYNATSLFIGEGGVRTTCNADEIAYFEFGASLAGDTMLDAYNALQIGVSEMELGDKLNRYGQHNSVVTIAAVGDRFEKAYLYPKAKKAKLNDKFSLTVGYRGGLSSRGGYLVKDETQLDEDVKDFMQVLVSPYFATIVHWLETIHCGMVGGDMYKTIQKILPQEVYHWDLCPGHLVGEEEWMSSPIYENSTEKLKSGMMLQTDIIPSLKGYGGASVESTICLADKNLRLEIQKTNPKLWERILKRRHYIEHILRIELSEDVLPMCSTVAYLRPYGLAHTKAMRVQKES